MTVEFKKLYCSKRVCHCLFCESKSNLTVGLHTDNHKRQVLVPSAVPIPATSTRYCLRTRTGNLFTRSNSDRFYLRPCQKGNDEHEQKRNKILRHLSRFQGHGSMERFRDYLEQTERDIQWSRHQKYLRQKPKEYKGSSVIPWQQQYIRKLEPPPCPKHGYERELTKEEKCRNLLLAPVKPICGQRPNIQPPWPDRRDHVNPCQLQSRWPKGRGCYIYENSGNNYLSGKAMY